MPDVFALGGGEVSANPEDRVLLDALPIAAGVVGRGGRGTLKLVAWNKRLRQAIEQSTKTQFNADRLPPLRKGRIAKLLRNYLAAAADAADEMDFRDGDGLAARYYRMKLAPLPRDAANNEPRCLVSLVDRTVEVEAERTLRAEMLRDSLTGLPNRLGFTEKIEKAGEARSEDAMGPVLGANDYTVLVVDLLRFSRINESMGSLAGDELLITFARRLVSTLRSGDVLARTGGNEFGVLVGIRRGRDDALAAADRKSVCRERVSVLV